MKLRQTKASIPIAHTRSLLIIFLCFVSCVFITLSSATWMANIVPAKLCRCLPTCGVPIQCPMSTRHSSWCISLQCHRTTADGRFYILHSTLKHAKLLSFQFNAQLFTMAKVLNEIASYITNSQHERYSLVEFRLEPTPIPQSISPIRHIVRANTSTRPDGLPNSLTEIKVVILGRCGIIMWLIKYLITRERVERNLIFIVAAHRFIIAWMASYFIYSKKGIERERKRYIINHVGGYFLEPVWLRWNGEISSIDIFADPFLVNKKRNQIVGSLWTQLLLHTVCADIFGCN